MKQRGRMCCEEETVLAHGNATFLLCFNLFSMWLMFARSILGESFPQPFFRGVQPLVVLQVSCRFVLHLGRGRHCFACSCCSFVVFGRFHS